MRLTGYSGAVGTPLKREARPEERGTGSIMREPVFSGMTRRDLIRTSLFSLVGLAGAMMLNPVKAWAQAGVSDPSQPFYELATEYMADARAWKLTKASLESYLERLGGMDTSAMEQTDQAYLLLLRNDARWKLHQKQQYGTQSSPWQNYKFARGLDERAHMADMMERYVHPEPHEKLKTGGVGKDAYEGALNSIGFVDMSAEELIAFARGEYERLDAEMTALAKKVNPEAGTWQEVYHQLRKDHPAKDKVIEAYEAEAKRANDFLKEKDLMDLPNPDPLTIQETPYWMKRQIPFAAYAPWSKTFLVTVTMDDNPETEDKQLEEHAYAGMGAIVVHEAYPGHHIQGIHRDKINVTFDSADPKTPVRRFLENNTDWHGSFYSEGWGVYSEDLMIEQGYYADEPGKKMLALRGLLWRAARAMIDPMVHTGEMTYDEAVDFMSEQVVMDRQRAKAEVNRYYARPIEVTSYYLGMKQFLQLRKTLQKANPALDLKAFHNTVLGRILPVPVLAKMLYGVDLEPLNKTP